MKNFLLLISVTLSCYINAQNLNFKLEDNVDLNSNGTIDHIIVEQLDNGTFKLKINNAEIIGDIEDDIDGFALIDINQWDKYKEIAVHTPGPSDDDVYMIYWYDGKEIKAMNQLSRWPKFKGNGIVYVNTWEGFWSPMDKYKLDNNTRKLMLVEQYAYYVGVKTQIKKGFKIYKSKELDVEVALLSDNSEIEIILCDKKGYDYYDYRYLIKSNSGLLGWADYRTIEKNASLMMAD